MENTENRLPIPVEEFHSIIEAAPRALELNTEITSKAKAAGEGLLKFIEENGMNEETDAKCNGYIIKIEERLKEMYGRRSPLTKLFDDIKGRFTELENELTRKKPNTITSKIQDKRNEFATHKADEQRRKEDEILRKQQIEKEKIDVLAEAKKQLHDKFNTCVDDAVNGLISIFESITLENHLDRKTMIESYQENFGKETFEYIVPSLASNYLSPEQIIALKFDARIGLFEEFEYRFKSKIAAVKSEYLQRFDGKIKYLRELVAADSAKQKQMEEQDRQRRQADAKRMEEQRMEEQRIKDASIEAEKQNATATAAFNNTVEVISNTTEGANPVTGHEIHVQKPAGWVLIFQKWFEKEGILKDNAAIGKKSMDQMKTFCEKLYTKEGEKIESPYLDYKTQYSVRAKK